MRKKMKVRLLTKKETELHDQIESLVESNDELHRQLTAAKTLVHDNVIRAEKLQKQNEQLRLERDTIAGQINPQNVQFWKDNATKTREALHNAMVLIGSLVRMKIDE